MTTRILLVRHGATVLSREDYYCGSTDVELSDTGRDQARALGERLAERQIHAAYCSDKKRAIETAELIVAPQRLTPRVDPALREIDHGHWEQKRRSDIEKEFAAEYAAWEADPLLVAPMGGETGLAVVARALPALTAIVHQNPGQTVLVVSHKATIRLLISAVLGFDMRGYRDRLDQHPACLNILDFKESHVARLMLFNDVSHYADHPTQPGTHLSKAWDTDKART